jgi:hypothetical protein
MPDVPLDVLHALTSVGLIPASVEVLGGVAELDDKVGREVLRFDFAPFFPPKTEEGRFIGSHNGPRV